MTTLAEIIARRGTGTTEDEEEQEEISPGFNFNLDFMRQIQLANAAHFPSIAAESGIPVLPELVPETQPPMPAYDLSAMVEDATQLERPEDSLLSIYGVPGPGDIGGGIAATALPALERAGRTIDVGAGVLRDVGDVVLQRIRSERDPSEFIMGPEEIRTIQPISMGEKISSDIQEIGSRAWDRIITMGQGENVRFESWISVLNRFIYGTSDIVEAGIEQGPLERGGIMAGGIALDVFLDPLWLIGRFASLGSKATKIAQINMAFDEIGLLRPSYRNMARLEWAQMETGQKLIEPGSPLWRIGEQVESQIGTLAMGSISEQLRSGQRGLISTLQLRRYDTLPIETMWSRASRKVSRFFGAPDDRFVFTTEYLPRGGRVLAPAMEALEKKGVSDFWTFLDMLAPSNMTRMLARQMDVPTARRTFGQVRQTVMEAQRAAGQKIRGEMYSATVMAKDIEKELDSIVMSRMEYLEETFGRMTWRERATTKKDLRRNLERMLNDYTEATAVRGDELESFLKQRGVEELPFDETNISEALGRQELGITEPARAAGTQLYETGKYQPGAAIPVKREVPMDPDWFYHVTEEGVRMQPTVSPGKIKVVPGAPDNLPMYDLRARQFDPLDLPLNAEFEHPEVRAMMEELRSWQKGYINAEAAAGLRVSELHPGGDPIDYIKKFSTTEGKLNQEIFDDLVSSYIWHRVSPATWEWMRSQKVPWIRLAAHTSTGWSTTKRFLDTWSQVLTTRKERRTLEAFNDYMRTTYEIENFFEPNPALREPARWLEGQRRIASVGYYSRMADHLAQFPEYQAFSVGKATGQISELGPVPDGWMRLSEMMSKRAWDAIAWDSAAAKKISSIMLPTQARDMVMRQAELLQRPDYLRPYMRFLQLSTNWWKTNTLGIWPGYHLGNFVSNLQLLWLGGMHDPLMFPLARKISSGKNGMVRSIATGVEYTYEDLRRMIKAAGVDVGFVRGNIEQAASSIHTGRMPRQLLEGYYTSNTPQDIIGGTLTMVTGIDPRGLDATNFAKKLLPGGEEWLLNRIGFMVGGAIEGDARISMFLNSILNDGMTPMQASVRVNQVLFDYTKRSGVKQIASTLIPFYEFTLQNTIFQAINFTQYPARTALQYRLLLQTIPAIQGKVDYEEIPEWIRGRALVKYSSDIGIDITRFMPAFETPAVLANPMGEGFGGANPFIELGFSLALNLDFFTKRQIEDYPGEKTYYDLAGYRVELPETAHHIFKNLFRAFSELERGDLLRTFTGIKLIELSESRSLQFDQWDIAREIQEYERGIDPSKIKSDEERERVRLELITLSAMNIAQLTKRYELGVDMNGQPLLPYSRAPNITDQFDVLNQAGTRILDIISYTRDCTTIPEDAKSMMIESWWGAWAENVQKRLQHLTGLAYTEPDNAGAGRSADPRQRERIEFYYNRALSVLDSSATVDNLGPFTYIALRNEYLKILTMMAENMIVPQTMRNRRGRWVRERYENFTGRHPEMEALINNNIIGQGE